MAEYFSTRGSAEEFIQEWYAKDGKPPVFFGKIFNNGTEKWIVNYDPLQDPRTSPYIKVLEDNSEEIRNVVAAARPKLPPPSNPVMRKAVTTTDDALKIYATRDLSASVIAEVPKGREIVLGDGEVVDGREWMEATLVGLGTGYVLGPNARGHTTLGMMPLPIKSASQGFHNSQTARSKEPRPRSASNSLDELDAGARSDIRKEHPLEKKAATRKKPTLFSYRSPSDSGPLYGVVLFALVVGWLSCTAMSPPPRQYFSPIDDGGARIWITIGAVLGVATVIAVHVFTIRTPVLKWKRTLLSFFAFVIVTSSLIGGALINKKLMSRRLAPFEDFVSHNASISTPPPFGSEPYVHGKVVTICSRQGITGVCPLFLKLSDDLQPNNSAEVGTIAYLVYGSKEVGTYNGGVGGGKISAKEQFCKVMLTDRTGKMVAPPASFSGGAPPQSITVKQDGDVTSPTSGPVPTDDVLGAYLQNLPRR